MQAREGFNLERKAETGEMWLLVRGSGEVDISAEAKNLEALQQTNWRTKCHQTRSLIQNCVRYVNITNDSDSLTHVCSLVRVGPKQTVFNPFPRRHLEPSPSECVR